VPLYTHMHTARFRVEDTSPRAVCRLAMLPERLCGSDGRYHTTSSKVTVCNSLYQE